MKNYELRPLRRYCILSACMSDFAAIGDRLQLLLGQIAQAAAESGRSADEITLIAVSKKRTFAEIEQVVSHGVRDIGESRVQVAAEKLAEQRPDARLHMIGHLQSNKVKRAIELFDMIQSVDSVKLAERINREAAELGKRTPILLEVNSSDEPQKYGFKPEDVVICADKIFELQNLMLCGLMTIAPLSDDEKDVRNAFALTRNLFVKVKDNHPDVGNFDTLSMGMSDDFLLAINEGATMVRIGTALFGTRSG